MRVEGDIKSLDFISWSDSGEGIGKLGINTLFASNSSLISNDPPIKAGEEIILKVTIVGHRDTADGGLTSGHIRSLDVNNDCVARGSDEQLGDYRAAGSMACVIKDKVTTENCLDMIYETSFNGGKDRSNVIVIRQVKEFGETDSELHTTAVKSRRSEPIQVDFNCHQGSETNMVVITKEKMRVEGDIKSLVWSS